MSAVAVTLDLAEGFRGRHELGEESADLNERARSADS